MGDGPVEQSNEAREVDDSTEDKDREATDDFDDITGSNGGKSVVNAVADDHWADNLDSIDTGQKSLVYRNLALTLQALTEDHERWVQNIYNPWSMVI